MKKNGCAAGRSRMRWSLNEYLRNNIIHPYENGEIQRCDQVKHNVLKPIPELGEGNPRAWL